MTSVVPLRAKALFAGDIGAKKRQRGDRISNLSLSPHFFIDQGKRKHFSQAITAK
jgi:hypothetical protein